VAPHDVRRTSHTEYTLTSSPSLRLLSALAIITVIATQARSAAPAAKESWIGMYFNGTKMGYTRIQTEPARFRGKAATKMTSTSVAKIALLGNTVEQNTSTTTYTDSSSRPIYQEYKLTSNGSTTNIKAEYLPGKIVCTIDSGGGPSKREITVPPGAKLVGDSSTPTQGSKLKAGQKETFYALEPLTVQLLKIEVEVKGEERVTLNGLPYQALRVAASTPFGIVTSWETKEGELLKGEMSLGIAMYREEKARALNLKSTAPKFAAASAPAPSSTAYKPSDFAQGTAIVVDKPIKEPRKATDLRLAVSGIDDPALVLSDERQQGTPTAGRGSAYDIRIRSIKFDANQSATLPFGDPALKPQLASAPYLETEDPNIQATAKELRGTDTNAYRVADRIRRWVHSNMKADYTIGVPRSCAEIFNKRRGVCRDYATLYAGLARAAGIPTRVVGGIVYAEGKFFYHAWAESWVGQWVAFDPTMDAEVVDATHVKFAQGDVTDMYKFAGLIGRLKVNVVEVN
jgi:hypothetical protein